MSAKRYTEEFKIEAIKQYGAPPAEREAVKDQQAEMRQLKAELKRVTEERDILKKASMHA